MADFDAQLERAQADGRISIEDADEIRTFRDFLEATADLPGPATPAQDWTPEQRRRYAEAYRDHYPDDYAHALAEHRARKENPCPRP